MADKPRILCVDDEPHVLEGLQLILGRRYDTRTAECGSAGLDRIREHGPFTAVISDMRMPGMNGAEFLARVRELDPAIVRVLLTGHTDIDAAIAAVNDGQIFRFLAKPSNPVQLLKAVADAVEQYRLVHAERELLEQTLMGSLRALHDVLALASPQAFGRADRVTQYVREMAAHLRLPDAWQVEAAALLSQIGYVTLDADTIEKLLHGRPLTAEEQKMAARVPEVNEQLIAHIPRLEPVRELLRRVGQPPRPAPAPNTLGGPAPAAAAAAPAAVDVLRIALDFDRLDGQGLTTADAFETMRARGGRYDPALLTAFAAMRDKDGHRFAVMDIPIAHVKPGMKFTEDVRMASGVLLAARGYVVTRAFMERARNFRSGAVHEPVRCVVSQSPEQAA